MHQSGARIVLYLHLMEYQLAKFNIEICIFVLVSDFKFLQSIDINYVKSDFDNSVD